VGQLIWIKLGNPCR